VTPSYGEFPHLQGALDMSTELVSRLIRTFALLLPYPVPEHIYLLQKPLAFRADVLLMYGYGLLL